MGSGQLHTGEEKEESDVDDSHISTGSNFLPFFNVFSVVH